MSNGAKRALFIALAAVVLVTVGYVVYTGRGTGTGASVANQQTAETEQIDPAYLQRIETLETALKSDPKNVATLSELGQLYFETGQADRAVMMFKTAIGVEPGNADLHSYLGLSYFWTGQSKEAIAEFTKVVDLDPQSPEPLYMLALAQYHSQPSDIPGATVNWKKIVDMAPGSPVAQKAQEYLDKTKGAAAIPTAAPALGKP